MNVYIVALVMKLRGLTQSDLARIAGVSRQAVSQWMSRRVSYDREGGARAEEEIDVRARVLMKLSQGLRIDPTELTRPLFQDNVTADQIRALKTKLLWDRSHDSLLSFVIALARKHPKAVARLVEGSGLFQAARVVGRMVWSSFPKYKQFITPPRRTQCEKIWKIQKDLGLI